MYELISVSENNWYIQRPAKIGLVRTDEGKTWLNKKGAIRADIIANTPVWNA